MCKKLDNDTLNILHGRVLELSSILVCESLEDLCDCVAFSNHEFTNCGSMDDLKHDLIEYTKVKEDEHNEI